MQPHSTYHRARLSLAIASALGVGLMILNSEQLGAASFEDFVVQNEKRDALSSVAKFSLVAHQGQAAAD